MEEIMEQHAGSTSFKLARRALLALVDANGFELVCHEGELWVTADGLAGDVVLAPGERLTLRGHPRVVISALSAASFDARPCCGNTPVRRLASRCAGVLLDRITRWRHAPLASYPATLLR
jgi:hypothetical protein